MLYALTAVFGAMFGMLAAGVPMGRALNRADKHRCPAPVVSVFKMPVHGREFAGEYTARQHIWRDEFDRLVTEQRAALDMAHRSIEVAS